MAKLPKDPHEMNPDELKLLLEIRKLEVLGSLRDLKDKLGIGYRILDAIRRSEIWKDVMDMVAKERKKMKPGGTKKASEKEVN